MREPKYRLGQMVYVPLRINNELKLYIPFKIERIRVEYYYMEGHLEHCFVEYDMFTTDIGKHVTYPETALLDEKEVMEVNQNERNNDCNN